LFKLIFLFYTMSHPYQINDPDRLLCAITRQSGSMTWTIHIHQKH